MGSVPISYGGGDADQTPRFKDTRAGKATKSAGKGLAAAGQKMIDDSRDEAAANIRPVQYRTGGKVRKTGHAVVHKGERVIPRSKVKAVEGMMKRKKMRMKDRS